MIFLKRWFAYNKITQGDVAGSVDFAPNKQQREVHAVLKERLKEQKARFDGLLNADLLEFNDFLKNNNIAGLVAPQIK